MTRGWGSNASEQGTGDAEGRGHAAGRRQAQGPLAGTRVLDSARRGRQRSFEGTGLLEARGRAALPAWGDLALRGPGEGPSCPRECEEFGRTERVLSDLARYQLCLRRDEADVSSYLQSFLLFPAKRPLLLGERLAAGPVPGLPRHGAVTGKAAQRPPRGQRGTVPDEGLPRVTPMAAG